MSRGRHESRYRDLARRFTHLVAAPVPPHGLSRALTAMSSWCNERHGPEGWASLHRSQRPPEPKDWAVFAFASAEDAAAFRQAWADKVAFD